MDIRKYVFRTLLAMPPVIASAAGPLGNEPMKRPALPTSLLLALMLVAAGLSSPAVAREAVPATAIPGVRAAQLDADYWVARQKQPGKAVLDAKGIADQNARLQEVDPSLHDIAGLPPTLDGAQVKAWIEALSKRPEGTLYDANGKEGTPRQIDRLIANLDLKDIPDTQVTRYGLVTRRADLRTFPSRLRVFNAPGNTDIDRFQESALFPGTPVVIAHRSRDKEWWFVVSNTYAAWVERDAVAEGSKQQVFGYAAKTPYLVVTGATAHTVFTPEQPQVSELQLDMGVRVPLLQDWPPDQAVNGQHPYTSYVVELPARDKDGGLVLVPALISRTQDVAADYLPLTRANVIRQSFKFLGERYGWGHSYNARDCSGFVSEVYRSLGVQLPRNTRDQAVSPALNRLAFTPDDSHARRVEVLKTLQVGDLIYIPGHVMMVIGQEKDGPYVIHDTTGITYRKADGALTRAHLNGVSVTPLMPLLFNETEPTVDRITSIQRIRP
jgi:cell wall-associated NlpC family hydrolase